MAPVRVSFERLRRGRSDIHGLRMANELRPRMLGSGSRANSRRFQPQHPDFDQELAQGIKVVFLKKGRKWQGEL